jgi:hypothetical protein
MGSAEPLHIVEVDNLAAVEHEHEVLCFPENRCTDYSWAECRDNQMNYYVADSERFVTWYSTPNGEPVFPRIQNDGEIEVYYRSRILDQTIVKARQQALFEHKNPPKPVTVPKIPKVIVDFAREFYDFVSASRSQVDVVKLNGNSDLKNQETNIRFNIFDDNCTVYGLGNIGIFLNKAKVLYCQTKPVVKLQTLKTRLEDATSRHRTIGYEIALGKKALQCYTTDLMEAETSSLNTDDLFSSNDILEIEEIISTLTKQITTTKLKVANMQREYDQLTDKIPVMKEEIDNWSPVGNKKNTPVPNNLAFVWRVIKFLNKWDNDAFLFLDALNEHANSFKPKDVTSEYFEDLKSKNIVLNVRTQPVAKRQATVPISAMTVPATASVATPVVAVATPVVAVATPANPAPVQEQRQPRQQRQAPPAQARPVQSRLARLGLAGKKQ